MKKKQDLHAKNIVDGALLLSQFAISFDPTVFEACDQNQNQNVQGLSKTPT